MVYCSDCKKGFAGKFSKHPHSIDGIDDSGVDFPGIELIPEFVTIDEELEICNSIDQVPWLDSQSGRRKQDFGPKVNFKKKKVNIGSFSGFPQFSRLVVDRFRSVDSLRDFVAVELCHLEYTPERGSAIDLHLDDTWLWGERLVTLNLLHPTHLTLRLKETEVLVFLPRRSLVILTGPARYVWQHAIKREHVTSRRLAMTFRELSGEFLTGGPQETIGRTLLDITCIYK